MYLVHHPPTPLPIRGLHGAAHHLAVGVLGQGGDKFDAPGPLETAQVLGDDGWLHTGDVARMDEKGYVYIVDRKKDMILVSGFNVYPNEVEDVVAAHPGVLEVAAIGVPDEKSGEAVKIFVVRKDPNLTAEDLRAHCKANLTGYKQPRFVEFRDSLPKSNVGKIIRRELRDAPKGAVKA